MRAFRDESVAVGLFASDHRVLSRSLKYHRPRGFFCLEGHCGGCLMRIDGVPNLRACMTRCADGLTLETQNAYPSADLDVLGAVDWLFPQGMNHHTLFTGSRLLNSVVNKVVRQLSGLGTLPGAAATERPPIEDRAVDVAIVGGGPAGLAAASEVAAAGAETVLVDEGRRPGGSLLADPRHGVAAADELARQATAAGAELWAESTLLACYPEDGEVLAIARPSHLVKLRARRVVYATGGYAQNRLFANNDRPGVLAARAVGRLLVEHGVVPASRVCAVGASDYLGALCDALAAVGCEVERVDDEEERVVGARGRSWVTGLDVTGAAGPRRLRCDVVAVDRTPAPASEAPRQHGCAVRFDAGLGGFAVEVDEVGRTSTADVFACGDVCGFAGPVAAAESGARAGREAAR